MIKVLIYSINPLSNRQKTVCICDYNFNNIYYSVITIPPQIFLDVVRYSQTVQALQLLLGFPENLEDPEIKK